VAWLGTQPTVLATTPPTADVALSGVVLPASVVAGGTATMSYRLANNGPDGVADVVLSIPMPADTLAAEIDLVPVAGSPSATCPVATPRGAQCQVALAAGASLTVQVTFQVSADAPNGATIPFDVSAVSTTLDPIPANNHATGTTTVSSTATPAASVDLDIAVQGPARPLGPGQTASYSVLVRNRAAVPADALAVTIMLPPNTTYQTSTAPPGFSCTTPAVGTAGTVRCTSPGLAAGGQASFAASVQLLPGASPGMVLELVAVVASSTTDPVPSNNRAVALVTVAPAPAPSPTSTPTPLPRPNVGVQVAPAAGTLQATITARDAGCAGGNNQLRSLQFTRLTNATVDVATAPVTTVSAPTTVSLPANPATVGLTVRRLAAGQAATAELVVVDGCGSWPTLVGGGPSVFGDAAPAARATPTASAQPTALSPLAPAAPANQPVTVPPTPAATRDRVSRAAPAR